MPFFWLLYHRTKPKTWAGNIKLVFWFPRTLPVTDFWYKANVSFPQKSNNILDFVILNKNQKEMRVASVTKPEYVDKHRPDHEFILAQRLVGFLYIHTILRPGKIPWNLKLEVVWIAWPLIYPHIHIMFRDVAMAIRSTESIKINQIQYSSNWYLPLANPICKRLMVISNCTPDI